MRMRDYRAKTCLLTENGARIGENAFSERNRDKQVKAWLGKAKTPLQNETVTRKSENAYTETKHLTFKDKWFTERRRPSQRRKRVYERKRTTNRRNRVYGTKMSPAKAKTRLQNENVAR